MLLCGIISIVIMVMYFRILCEVDVNGGLFLVVEFVA